MNRMGHFQIRIIEGSVNGGSDNRGSTVQWTLDYPHLDYPFFVSTVSSKVKFKMRMRVNMSMQLVRS